MNIPLDPEAYLSSTGAVDLTNCDREPITTPSAVQSHGMLLVAREPELRIAYASANSFDFLGITPAHLFRMTLPEVMGTEAMQAVGAHLLNEISFATSVISFNLPIAYGSAFDIQVHRISDLVYIEIEHAVEQSKRESLSARLQAAIGILRRAHDLKALCDAAAKQMQKLTGYDRTMIYRFDRDAHGQIVAESALPGRGSFLGLHFPATDIPVQARALYLKQRQRVIADISALTSPVLEVPLLAEGVPLDMTYCSLRAVSPIHLEYLANMDVQATMAISLICEDRLWGMIVCHHRSRRNPDLQLRALTALLGEVLSMLIAGLEQAEQYAARRKKEEILDRLRSVTGGRSSVAVSLVQQADAVLDLVKASGACIRLGGKVFTIGTIPAEAPALMTAFQKRLVSGIGSSDEVGAFLPEFASLAPMASGALMIQFMNRPEDGILWVRPEAVRNVTWAGDPGKPVNSAETGRPSPRKSFAAWQEVQRGRSLPWTAMELEAARSLQRLVTTALLHRAESELAQLSQYDPLTELPNRRMLMTQLAAWQASGSDEPACLMFLDLDNFKTMNDSMGHEVGDQLLNLVARRLLLSVDGRHLVARLGGDEFVVFCKNTTVAEGYEIASAVLAKLADPFLLQGASFHTSASIGIAAVDGSGMGEHGEPLRAADSAMYVAKQNGGNQAVLFESPQHDKVIRQNILEQGLFKALERNELSLVYQPQVALLTGMVVGFEALMRWKHPKLGAIGPAEFIPLAEKLGLIDSMGYWAMEQSVLIVQRWRALFEGDYTVSVNVSMQQIMKSDFALGVETLLKSTGLAPSALCLEITEGILMHELAVLQIGRLRAAGVRISIDDFGTGYSSLGYLQRIPVDEIKLDRSLLQGLGTDKRASALLGAIVNLAHTFDLLVVAEGVETDQQWTALRQLRCDIAQGYYLCRPVGTDSVEEWLGDEGRINSLMNNRT